MEVEVKACDFKAKAVDVQTRAVMGLSSIPDPLLNERRLKSPLATPLGNENLKSG